VGGAVVTAAWRCASLGPPHAASWRASAATARADATLRGRSRAGSVRVAVIGAGLAAEREKSMQRSANREVPIFAASARGKPSHGRFRVKDGASLRVGRFLHAHALLSPSRHRAVRAQSPPTRERIAESRIAAARRHQR